MTEDSFRSSGLRAGRLFGIDIWVHWILLAIIALKLIDILLEPGGHYGAPMVAFASFALALLVTILLPKGIAGLLGNAPGSRTAFSKIGARLSSLFPGRAL